MNRIALLLLTSLLSLPIHAEEDARDLIKALSHQVAELAKQVKQANARIGDLEKKLERAQAEKAQAEKAQAPAKTPESKARLAAGGAESAPQEAKPAVTVGDAKGTFKIPGTDTSIGLGGFAKMDAIYSSVSAGRDKLGDQALTVPQIPVGALAGQHGRVNLHVKESRVWLKSYTPTAWGDLNAFVEVDFFGAADSYALRLRHAYGSLGHFLAGQTWTTLLNVAAIPDVLDIGGPVGNAPLLRQPMLRWRQPFSVAGAPLEFQFALESPRIRLWTNSAKEKPDSFGFVQPNAERYPDLIARLDYAPDWGTLSLVAMGRQIRYTEPKSGERAETWGGAASIAGKVDTVGLDNVRFMLNYGNAFGRYASNNAFEDAALQAETGRLRLINAYSAMLAYQHWWNKSWRSTVAYGYEQADQPAFVSGELTRRAQSVHANLLWSPLLYVTLGLEYIRATRQIVDGRSGALDRWQVSTRVNF
jgi:hypothetical protein